MGALAASLKARHTEPQQCAFGAIIAKHADADDKAWIDNPRVSSKAIAEEVAKAWESVSDTNVRRHRKRECRCYRGQAE